MKTITDILEVAKQMNADISVISWGGFNLAGDRESIGEVCRLMHQESRLHALLERNK